jgi:hypothetical protein
MALAIEDRQRDNDLTTRFDNAGGKFSTRPPRKSAKLCERESLSGRTSAPLSQHRIENTIPRGSNAETEVPPADDQAKNHSVIDLTDIISDGESHFHRHIETNLEDGLLKDRTIIKTQWEGMKGGDGTPHNHSFDNNDTHTSTTNTRTDSAPTAPDASSGTITKCLILEGKFNLPNSPSTGALTSSTNGTDESVGEQLLNRGYSISTAPPIEHLQKIIQMRALTLWRDNDYASKEYSSDLRKRIEEVNKKSDAHARRQLAPQFTTEQWNQIYRSVEKRFQKHTMEVGELD